MNHLTHTEQLKLANQFVNEHGYDLSKHSDEFIAKYASEHGRNASGTEDFVRVLNKVAVQRAMAVDKKSEIELKKAAAVTSTLTKSPYFKQPDLHKEVQRDVKRIGPKPVAPKKSINTATGQSDMYAQKVASMFSEETNPFRKIASEIEAMVIDVPKTVNSVKEDLRVKILGTWASRRYNAIMDLLRYFMDNYKDDYVFECTSATMANSKIGHIADKYGVSKNLLIDIFQAMFKGQDGVPPEFYNKWDTICKFRREGMLDNEFYYYTAHPDLLAARIISANKTAHYLAEKSINSYKVIELFGHYFHLPQYAYDNFIKHYQQSNKLLLHNDSVYTINPELDYNDEAKDYREFSLKDMDWTNPYSYNNANTFNGGMDFTPLVINTIKTLQENYAYQLFVAMYDYLDNKLEGVIND